MAVVNTGTLGFFDSSMSTNTQDDSESETQTSQASPATVDLGEGLQMLHGEIVEQLAEIEADGEQVKLAVGHAILASDMDADVAGDLQSELVDLLGEKHQTHEEVGIDEITLALWAELNRVAQMSIGTSESSESSNKAGEETSNSDESTAKTLNTPSGEESLDNTESTMDPAFQ